MFLVRAFLSTTTLKRPHSRTHIIASQLTPAKILEYQRAKLKVVKPEWIVKSVESGVLQKWQDFALKPSGTIAALGKGTDFSGVVAGKAEDVDQSPNTRRAPQKTLAEAFISQKKAVTTPTQPRRQDPLRKPSDGAALIAPRDEKDAIAHPSTAGHDPTLRQATFDSPPRKGKASANTSPTTDGKPAVPLVVTTSPSPTRKIPDLNVRKEDDDPKKPSYAMYDSNPFAERFMESTQWRHEKTSANAAAFTESYFQNSRLHHLSTWKSELKELVAKARERAERNDEAAATEGSSIGLDPTSMQGFQLHIPARTLAKGKGKATDGTSKPERVIMHCDFDSFFVAAGLVGRPELKGKPVVVCHSGSGKASTSEIASASYEARSFGIKNGMSYVSAYCPPSRPPLNLRTLIVSARLDSSAPKCRVFLTNSRGTSARIGGSSSDVLTPWYPGTSSSRYSSTPS